MQEIESTKQNIDPQPSLQLNHQEFDFSTNNQNSNQLLNNSDTTSTAIINNTSLTTIANSSFKKIDNNRFQASLERQRRVLNMEQQLIIYPSSQQFLSSNLSATDQLEDKMEIQVDSNNNTMTNFFNNNSVNFNRQPNSLPSMNEFRYPRTNQLNLNFNSDNLFTNNDKKSRSAILNTFNNLANFQNGNQFTNSTENDDNEFENHFEEDDYSRLSHTNTIYDNYELNQSIKMEDAFQDDKLDFKTGPTLAELNLNDDDMVDNLPTVNPNSVLLCPSMPLQVNKNGFLMGINCSTISLTSTNSSLTTTTIADSNRQDLVSFDEFSSMANGNSDRFTSQNSQTQRKNNHLNNSSTNNGSTSKKFDISSTNHDKQSSSSNIKQNSNNTRKRRIKSENDKKERRTNQQQNNQGQQSNNQSNESQQQQQNLSQSNQVLCKLLNKKNENLNNNLNNSLNNLSNIYFINTTKSDLINTINSFTNTSNGQSIPSISTANNSQFQTICVSPLSNASSTGTQLSPNNLTTKAISPQPNLSSLQNDLLLNQLQSSLVQQQQVKCSQTNNLRINNSNPTNHRNRNSSISTEHSFSSSHDEGFISQAEDDSDEKELDDSQMVCDKKSISVNNKNKAKRKRVSKDVDKDLTNKTDQKLDSTNLNANRNMKKIKLEDNNQFKPSTSASFSSTLATVKEEQASMPIANKKEEKIGTKSLNRVNYKITKEKPMLVDLQNQNQFKLDKSILNDEKIDEESSDDEEDDESFLGDYDAHDLIGATTSDDQLNKWSLNMGRSRKNSCQRYFWQYNVQSKGPKGTKLTTSISDNAFEGDLPACSTLVSDLEPLDPVFSPNCQIEGVKHAGKARRGDGNDLTPAPRKLLMIGLELKKLSQTINDLTPVADVPVNSKSSSRKEKNKLASRACRLKKKAQHEANKIKLHGLSIEYKKLFALNNEFKKIQDKVIESGNTGNEKMMDQLNALIKEKGPIIIASKTTEFVNSVLDSVSSGNGNGGLEKL